MKKTLVKSIPVPNSVFTIDEVKPGKYYGVLQHDGLYDLKGFVSRESYNYGSFILLGTDNITNGNRWSQYRNLSLKDLLNTLANGDVFQIFQFDTFQELFTWIGE